MKDLNWDTIAWPSPGTRVYTPENQAPFVPAPLRHNKRQCALDRHTRYRHRKRLLKSLTSRGSQP